MTIVRPFGSATRDFSLAGARGRGFLPAVSASSGPSLVSALASTFFSAVLGAVLVSPPHAAKTKARARAERCRKADMAPETTPARRATSRAAGSGRSARHRRTCLRGRSGRGEAQDPGASDGGHRRRMSVRTCSPRSRGRDSRRSRQTALPRRAIDGRNMVTHAHDPAAPRERRKAHGNHRGRHGARRYFAVRPRRRTLQPRPDDAGCDRRGRNAARARADGARVAA